MSTTVAVPKQKPLDPAKFRDPERTAGGEQRAEVKFKGLKTLWFNTGTLCNLTCERCYIESSPVNDRLVYLSVAEVEAYLKEIAEARLETEEIGFTGGEPFMNPDIVAMLEAVLAQGYRSLVLTNAMRPMMKRAESLLDLNARFGAKLRIRVSLDHYGAALHESERGVHSFTRTLHGLDWLARHGFAIAIAGRTLWGEAEDSLRAGYDRLFARHGIALNAKDPEELVLFPEMDAGADVPEITTSCWGILGVNPDAMMCATSRMVVKRRGSARPAVVACTLLPYDPAFELGATLANASGGVRLNHPHCAKFCVLGGGSCSSAQEA